MVAMTIVSIVVAIVILLVLFKILKSIVSFAFSAAGIVIITYLVIMGLRYADEQDLRENLLVSNNLILVEESGNIISGFSTYGDALDLENIDPEDESLYSEFYKVIVIPKDTLGNENPEDYFNDILTGDPIDNLIEKEESEELAVYQESMAFKHGLEVFGI